MREVFGAIVAFIDDLWEVYGNKKKATPLALYHRLTEHIKFNDVKGMEQAVSGFQDFFMRYERMVLGNELESIPPGTTIKYGRSERVYLEIQKFIYQADRETKDAIRRHLMTISTILEPNKEKMEQLEQKIEGLNLASDTPEGEFLNGIMGKAKDTMENLDAENPAAAIMGMFQSGIIGDMMTGLQEGMSSGEMDMGKLLGSMQTAIGSLIPEGADMSSTTKEVQSTEVISPDGTKTVTTSTPLGTVVESTAKSGATKTITKSPFGNKVEYMSAPISWDKLAGKKETKEGKIEEVTDVLAIEDVDE